MTTVPRVAAPGDICAAQSTGKMQSGREDATGDDDGATRGAGRGVDAARGTGEVSTRRPGGTCSTGAGTRGGTTGSLGASAEVPVVAVDDPGLPGRIPAGKSLCCGAIGSDTMSGVSRNSKAAGERGPSRSAKGKAASSKMTCLEMMMLHDEGSAR
jgi:hypothetical protein